MQGTNNNYEIDLFRALIAAAQQATGYNGDPANPSLRVISDHLRAMSFLIAEGVLPSNEGRGYVLRRIMRRAMRHATLLGASEPVSTRSSPPLCAKWGKPTPSSCAASAWSKRPSALRSSASSRPSAAASRSSRTPRPDSRMATCSKASRP